jgi:hypothetical protein
MMSATRDVLTRVVNLELLLLPRLKGKDEELVRELVWAAHDALKLDAELRSSDVARRACAVAAAVAQTFGPLAPEKSALVLCAQCGARYTPDGPKRCRCPVLKSGPKGKVR